MLSKPTENQFHLLSQTRFGWFFITQCLGAFNDNLFKMALIVLIAFQVSASNPALADMLANICTAAFVLPFFFFSAIAGQLADKFNKATYIRTLKAFELVITLIAAWAFYIKALPGLVGLLILMGTQSALFGPAKYSYLPRHLSIQELLGGNGLVEMGTFMGILIGTLTGGLLMGIGPQGTTWVSLATLTVAFIGWRCAQHIPDTPATTPYMTINYNFLSEIYYNVKLAAQHRNLFILLLAISWFWLLGSTFLTQVGNYTARFLQGQETVVTALIACFSIGIAAGGLACERLSKQPIEKGLVLLGAIGIGLFTLAFSLIHHTFPPAATPVTLLALWQHPSYIGCLMILSGLGISCGLYIVPLYALVQHLSPPDICARIIATNNMLNALFMVLSALLAISAFTLGASIPHLFKIMTGLHLGMMLLLIRLDPTFWTRFKVWARPGTS